MLVSLHCINVRDIPAVDIGVTQPTTRVTSQEEASIVARNKLSFDNRVKFYSAGHRVESVPLVLNNV